MTSARCRRPGCNRSLRAPSSVGRGMSLRCARIEREREELLARAVEPYSQDQRVKAFALIAGGGLTETNRPGAYRALSSDKRTSYLVLPDAGFCECPSRLRCYHLAGAALMAASGKAA